MCIPYFTADYFSEDATLKLNTYQMLKQHSKVYFNWVQTIHNTVQHTSCNALSCVSADLADDLKDLNTEYD